MNLKTYSRFIAFRFTAALAFAISANRNAMRPANRRAPKGVCLPLLLLSFLLTQGRVSAQVTATPNPLDFGVVYAGEIAGLSLTCVVNGGVTVDALTITGANASRFQIVSQQFAAAPAASSVFIRFTQSAAGSSAATLNIPYHRYNSATGQTITGLTTVALTASPPPSLDFGAVPFGQTKDLTFTGKLYSTFGGAQKGYSLAITGANAGDFQIVSEDFVGKIGSFFATQGFYNVVVRFHPTAGGTRAAALALTTGFPYHSSYIYSTQTVPLTGVVTGAPPVAVTGLVGLEGAPDLSVINSAATQGGNFTVSFRQPGTTAELYGATTGLTLSANHALGSFTLPAVPPGTYDVAIKGWKWLRVSLPSVAIYGPLTLPAVTLPAGDANNDNSVDPADFAIFVSAYNSDSGIPGSGYNGNADFNLDGAVDATDFGLLVGNYGSVGAP